MELGQRPFNSAKMAIPIDLFENYIIQKLTTKRAINWLIMLKKLTFLTTCEQMLLLDKYIRI